MALLKPLQKLTLPKMLLIVLLLQDVRMCLQLEPYHFGAWSGLGLTHMHCKQYPEAEKAFEKALEIHPWMMQTSVGVNHRICRAAGQASES